MRDSSIQREQNQHYHYTPALPFNVRGHDLCMALQCLLGLVDGAVKEQRTRVQLCKVNPVKLQSVQQ